MQSGISGVERDMSQKVITNRKKRNIYIRESQRYLINSLNKNNPSQLPTIIVEINKIIFIFEAKNEFTSSLVKKDLNHSLYIVLFTP